MLSRLSSNKKYRIRIKSQTSFYQGIEAVVTSKQRTWLSIVFNLQYNVTKLIIESVGVTLKQWFDYILVGR